MYIQNKTYLALISREEKDLSMRFYVPTDIYVEKDCVKNHAQNLLAIGKHAFIMTGRTSAKKNGSLNDVTAVLDAGHVPYQVFDQVEENPSTDTVGNATQQAREFGADYIIGIGGGSAIDAAKAAALLLANPNILADNLHKAPEKPLNHVPVVRRTDHLRNRFRGQRQSPLSRTTRLHLNEEHSAPHFPGARACRREVPRLGKENANHQHRSRCARPHGRKHLEHLFQRVQPYVPGIWSQTLGRIQGLAPFRRPR
jgi:Alcohol dehydrogenase, class IV